MKSYNRKINDWMTGDTKQVIRWFDARKGHRKARWLKMLNRTLDYYTTYVF